MNATEKLELNAQIERLVDSKGHDEDARRAVAEFGSGIRQGSPMSFKAEVTKKGDTIVGQTEHGTIAAENERPETKEYSAGEVVERIGYYKLWRQKRWIHMSHFWKSDLGTESEAEMAQEWALSLDRKGAPEWFGERARHVVFSFHITRALQIVVSRNVFVENWGVQEGRHHHGGFIIAVTVDMDRDH